MPFTLTDSSNLLEQQLAGWDEAADGSTVIIAGISYACAVTPGRAQGILKDGGWLTVQDLRVDIRKTLLAAPPPTQTSVTWNGRAYELQNHDGDAPGALAWVLRCRRIL